MKKIFLLLFLWALSIGLYAQEQTVSDERNGLRRCSTEIIEITLQETKQMKRRPCKVCGGEPHNCKAKAGEEKKSKPKKTK